MCDPEREKTARPSGTVNRDNIELLKIQPFVLAAVEK
jgi:hypothetical protein